MDNFPDDQARLTRQLQKDVSQAQGSAATGRPLTEASKGWKIPDQGFPATPASGGHLTASSGEPIWTESGGAVYSLKPQMSPGTPVTDPPDFTSSTSAGATYDASVQNMLTALRADAAGTKITLDALLSSLRGAGVIDF